MATLTRSNPEQQGVSSAAIIAFLKDVEKDIQHLHSFMLLRHGHVISEGWWHPWQADEKHMLFSLSKSFTSAAIGIAIHERLFHVTDHIVDLFPEQLPAMVSENLAKMQIQHLLSMSTGHSEETTNFMVYEEDPVRAFLALPVEHKPGSYFVYNSGATFILSNIITRFTGLRLLEYLETRLFRPLGIENPKWECHPNGVDFGGWGLSIKTEDIARFGQLFLQKGKWDDKQLVPESWVQEVSRFQVDNAPAENPDWAQGYGYQFWRCSPSGVYRGDGAFGQFCIIMPEEDAVISITAGVQNMQSVLTKIWEHILPAMEKEPLPILVKENQDLQKKLSELSIYPLPGSKSPDKEKLFGDQTFVFGENDFLLDSIQLDFENNRLNYQIIFPQGEKQYHTLKFGRGSWEIGEAILANKTPYKAAISGSWVNENTFQLCICHIEMPFITNLFITFTGGNITLHFKYNVSFGPLESAPFSSL